MIMKTNPENFVITINVNSLNLGVKKFSDCISNITKSSYMLFT